MNGGRKALHSFLKRARACEGRQILVQRFLQADEPGLAFLQPEQRLGLLVQGLGNLPHALHEALIAAD